MEDALHVYSAEVENLDPQIGGAPPEFDPLEFEPGNIKSDPIRDSFESSGESDGTTGSITEITDQIRRWGSRWN